MARMDDMERMDGMDAMDYMEEMEDPTIQICLNCTAADCRGSCYRINCVLAGLPDPGPGTETNDRHNLGRTRVETIAKKWNKAVSSIYTMASKYQMSLDEIDQYYADRAEKAAFLEEMKGFAVDQSKIYRMLRSGKTYDEIRAMYRDRPQEVA